MAKKKEPDKLELDMIECEKAGYGCHYGKWKAMQPPVKYDQKDDVLPEGWALCERCGKPFKKHNMRQRFCDIGCRGEAYDERQRTLQREYYAQKRKEEKKREQ